MTMVYEDTQGTCVAIELRYRRECYIQPQSFYELELSVLYTFRKVLSGVDLQYVTDDTFAKLCVS